MTTTVDETTDKRAAYTSGLRELADWLDEHPEVPAPQPTLTIYSAKYGTGRAIAEAALVARAMGTCDKSTDDSMDAFLLTRQFGPIALRYRASRSAVCEKRTVTRTVEEWVCPDSLLREADERAAAEAAK